MKAHYMTIAMIKLALKRNGTLIKKIPTGRWSEKKIYEVSIDLDNRIAKVRRTFARHSCYYPPYAAVWQTIQKVSIDTFDILDEIKTEYVTNSQKYDEL